MKWTVRVTGDPMPKVIWMRDGFEIPDCEEVRIVDVREFLLNLFNFVSQKLSKIVLFFSTVMGIIHW